MPDVGCGDGRLTAELGARELTAADVMIKELVHVTAETPVTEIADTMRRQRIHRVLVMDDKELVGIVTTFDLIGALAPARKTAARPNGKQAGDPVC